jgi:hypothetical protein
MVSTAEVNTQRKKERNLDRYLLWAKNSAEPYRLVLLAKAGWREFARFVQNPFSRPTPEELKIFNERHKYDRLNPRRGNG